jgi:uncharacterized membrane protein
LVLSIVNAYTILTLIHVLAAVIWVGGAVTINIVGTRVIRSAPGAQRVAFAKDTAWMGLHVYMPASLTVLLFGILATLKAHYSFASAWIILGIVGIVLTALTGSLFLGPELRRIAAIVEQRGFEDPEGQDRLARLVSIARIDLVVLLLVVVDMVLKPGA